MLVIPGIDIKGGKCVRLRQGRMSEVTVFSDDPVAQARHWLREGARRLHLVDLDGAVAGAPRNAEVIGEIVRAAGTVPVQVGGGVRSFATLKAYLDAGVSQVIIGTRAVEDPDFFAESCRMFPGRVTLGIDARDGRIATDGWRNTSKIEATAFARWAKPHAPAAIVYTDISRDGMLSGLNVAATVALAEASGLPVIASGGVTSLADIEALAQAACGSRGEILGAIVGRAIYEGTLELKAAQAWLDTRG